MPVQLTNPSGTWNPNGTFMGQNRFGMPTLPNMTGAPATGGVALDRQNIDALLRGDFDPYEINMQSAENAVGGGMAGSGFAQAGRYKLLDSEKLARQRLGHEELEPYTNRAHQAALQTQAEAARMREIQADAEYAMQRLQASEAGLGARLSQQERAELEQLVLRGNQAMDLERLNQEGQRDITERNIRGNIVQTLLRGAGGGGGSTSPNDPGLRYNAAKYGGRSFRYTTGLGGIDGVGGSPPPNDYWTPSSGGGGGDRNVNNIISGILRRYGFGNL